MMENSWAVVIIKKWQEAGGTGSASSQPNSRTMCVEGRIAKP